MYLGEDQYGFKRGVGTRDAIAVTRVITERCTYTQSHRICVLSGLRESIRQDKLEKMMEILKNIGVDWRNRRLLKELYMNQTARVRIDNILSETCEIGRENRQGCPLYDEAMIKKTVDGEELGIKLGGECLHTVRFAVDKAMLSSTVKGLQTLMTKLNDVSEEFGMKINAKKTKIMEKRK